MKRRLDNSKRAVRRKHGKGTFYRKSLLFALMLAFVPAATVGLLLYVIGIPRIESEFSAIHKQQLMQATNRIDDALSNLELSASQLVFSPIFDNHLRDIDLRDQFAITQNLYRTLSVMKGSNPLIGQVHLYLQHTKSTISDDRGVTPVADAAALALYSSLLGAGESVFWTDSLSRIPAPGANLSPMTLVLKLPGGGVGQVYGLMIIYLNSVKMDQLAGIQTPYHHGASLLMEERGELISNGHGLAARATAFEMALRDKVFAATSLNQSLLFSWKNETYSVSSQTFSRLGSQWVYATATPLAQLTAPVLLLSRIIMGTSGLVLLAAIVISWQASLRLYRPVHRLVGLLWTNRDAAEEDPHKDEFEFIERRWHHVSRESQILQVKLEQQLPSLRQGLLLQLVQGHLYALSEAELTERMIQYGWDVRDKSFAVLLVQLSGNLDGTGKFSEGDNQLVTFSAGNVAEEMARTRSPHVDVIHLEDMMFGLLLLFPSGLPDEQVKSDLRQLTSKLMQTLSSLLLLDVTVSIGRCTASARRLPEVFEEARQTLRYRDVNRSCQILDAEQIMPHGKQDVFYPFELDKQIIQSIRMGMEDEAIGLVEQFVKELQARAAEELLVRQTLVQLLGNIQYAILQSGFNPHEIYGASSLIDQFNQLHKPELMIRWFKNHVIRPYIHAMVHTTDIQNKRLVEKAMVTMEETYMKDISLEWCADQHGTYPQKLSIAFKQVTGINFIDYLTRLRLEKSMQLLTHTDIKINDIAEQVGYHPSYYNRLFKKQLNMTPGQYREQTAKKQTLKAPS